MGSKKPRSKDSHAKKPLHTQPRSYKTRLLAGFAIVLGVGMGGYLTYSPSRSHVPRPSPQLERGNYLHPDVIQETLERLLQDPRMGEGARWVDSIVYDPNNNKELYFLEDAKKRGIAENKEWMVQGAEKEINDIKSGQSGPRTPYGRLLHGFAKTLCTDLSFSKHQKSVIFFKKSITDPTIIKTYDDVASIVYHELFHTLQNAYGLTVSKPEIELLAQHNLHPGRIPLDNNDSAMQAIIEAEAYGNQLLKIYDSTFQVNPSLRKCWADIYQENYSFIEKLSHKENDEGLFAKAILHSLPIRKK